MRFQLHNMGSQQGNSRQRTVHYLLIALELRRQGRGFEVATAKPSYKLHEFTSAVSWLFTGQPLGFIALSYAGRVVLSSVAGKPQLHLVLMGAALNSLAHLVLRQMAAMGLQGSAEGGSDGEAISCAETSSSSSSGSGSGRGSGESCGSGPGQYPLQKLRVTFISTWNLSRTQRCNMNTFLGWIGFCSDLERTGAEVGVDVSASVLQLDEDNLDSLDSLRREPGETVVVCTSLEFHHMSDDPNFSGNPQQRLMKAISNMRPEAVVFSEIDAECSSHALLPRFQEHMSLLWAFVDMLDKCCTQPVPKLRKNRNLVEHLLFVTDAILSLSCDGTQRRLRMHSHAVWQRLWEFWGAQAAPPDPQSLLATHEILRSYPSGFDAFLEGAWTCIAWKGRPLLSACTFTFPQKKKGHSGRLSSNPATISF